jgi:NAD(P)H-hydrate epimerase
MQPTPLDAKTLRYLSPRPVDAHKGLFGHALVIGGDCGMAGAVRLAAEAAARVGAGLVSLATRPEHLALINAARPELMCHGVQRADDLSSLIARATVIVIGTGLGQSSWSEELFNFILTTTQPKIIDADGLNLLARQPCKLDDWILTPHVGEAARLLACTAADIQNDRLRAVENLQQKFGGVIVLKGAGTLIAAAENIPAVCKRGNPGMASGGMGDVLSGVIGGLVAQKLSLRHAAELGVYIHARAGDEAARLHGERGLLALDLMPFLQKLVNSNL